MNYGKSKFWLLLFCLLFANCTARKAKQGPEPIGSGATGAPVSGPEASNRPAGRINQITLVLGGAGVASFATVGLLKKFEEEGIHVETIITTGWPTLFSLGYGFLKSVHDLEWFAMRLQEKDFYRVGVFDLSKGFAEHDKLSDLVEASFKQKDLNETRIPIIISAANTELAEPEISSQGDWKVPLLKTMSVPGIYRPFQGAKSQWINSLQGIDVDEAVRRGAKFIVAVNMYDDYFNLVQGTKKDSSDAVFRQLYLANLNKSMGTQLKLAHLTSTITLGKLPQDFSAKRMAILAGAREAARLAKLLRN